MPTRYGTNSGGQSVIGWPGSARDRRRAGCCLPGGEGAIPGPEGAGRAPVGKQGKAHCALGRLGGIATDGHAGDEVRPPQSRGNGVHEYAVHLKGLRSEQSDRVNRSRRRAVSQGAALHPPPIKLGVVTAVPGE
jgi:hypothetical protein